MPVTHEEAIDNLAAEKAAIELETRLYLEPVPVYRRRGPRLDVVGWSGNLRAVFIFPHAAHESDRYGYLHSSLQANFQIARPDVDHGVFDDAGTAPASAAAALAAFYDWSASDAARHALTSEWMLALSSAE